MIEPFPEALTDVSTTGVLAPDKIPLLAPYVPERSDAWSKPTHFTTPGWLHRVEKLDVVGGGVVEDAFTVNVKAVDFVSDPAADATFTV